MNEINLENQNSPSPQPSSNKTFVGVIICVAVVVIMFVIIIGSVGGSSTYLTYENYIKIHNGMTYREVVEVLDNHEGELNTSAGYGDYTLTYYSWSNSSGSRCIVVGFENGKVCAKSQYGLN